MIVWRTAHRRRRDGGAVAVLVALLLVPMIGFVGLVTDGGRGYLLQSRLSQAVDAAALAGGRVMFDSNRDADVRSFFRANFPKNLMNARVDGPHVAVDAQGENLTLTASATIDTTFMRIFNHKTMTVAARAVVKRSVRGMELALVLDNTGSMREDGKIEALRAGATELINIFYGERERIPNFWVSLVPFVTAVNVGNGHTDWLAAGAIESKNYTGVPGGWKGCVEARHAHGNDMTDAPPSVEPFQPFYFPSGSDNSYPPVDESYAAQSQAKGKGPNVSCPAPVSAMVDDKATILAAIDDLRYWRRGGTMINMGLVWGWRALSPNWRGLWSAATPQLPLDYGTPFMDKALVLLTDGKNEISSDDYTSYGRLSWGRLGTTNRNRATQEVNRRTAEACITMKQQGIIIFTIGFRVEDAATHALLRDCASKAAYYFASPTNEDLRRAFRTIGATLSNLRLAQ
ncbi:MAG: Flp pilus assembly protein TadG [Rhodospirillales bacterium]|nr:Flp pilus assembly protein TadG [Rhodospirillales bacterium]